MRRILMIFSLGLLLGAAEPDLVIEGLKDQAVMYAQSQADTTGGNYTFQIVKPPALPNLHRKGSLSFQASHISKSDLMGRFFVTFQVLVDGVPAGLCRVDMEGKWKGNLLRTVTALPRKTVPDTSQYEEVPFEGTPPPGALTSMPEGVRLRVAVGTGHTLTRLDFEPIPMVNTGDRVRVELNWGSISITSDAIARNNAPKGERVRLELPSRKIINAVVVAPGEARTAWVGGR